MPVTWIVVMGATTQPRALFIAGSLNQTTQLHAIAKELAGFDISFTPYYGTKLEEAMRRVGLNEGTICGDKRRAWCRDYLRAHDLPLDENGQRGGYDLVVTCSDLIVPENVRSSRIVVVQEGILDPEGLAYRLCRRFPFLPRWLASTAMTGLSGRYEKICVASDGYREHLMARGVPPWRIEVTGIPNFDHCAAYANTDFPLRRFVLVCTSDTRETWKHDDVDAFLERCRTIANGREVVFKLHPNEDVERSTRAIRRFFPDATIFATGSAEEMIACCDVLITQWSSTAFVGLALGKEVHSNFALDELRRLMPIQNGGTSARKIAEVCRATARVRAWTPEASPILGRVTV